MSTLKLIVLTSTLALTVPGGAAAVEKYRCEVVDVTSFSDDDEFKRKNKLKIFDLHVTDTEVITFVTSPDFQDHEKRYEIIRRSSFDVYAMGESKITGTNTLVLPINRSSALSGNGAFNATVALHSHDILNTWLLRCRR